MESLLRAPMYFPCARNSSISPDIHSAKRKSHKKIFYHNFNWTKTIITSPNWFFLWLKISSTSYKFSNSFEISRFIMKWPLVYLFMLLNRRKKQAKLMPNKRFLTLSFGDKPKMPILNDSKNNKHNNFTIL